MYWGFARQVPPSIVLSSVSILKAWVELLYEAQRRGLKLDVVSYSSAIAALAARGEYDRVIGLIGAMQEQGVEPTAFSWTAAAADAPVCEAPKSRPRPPSASASAAGSFGASTALVGFGAANA